MQKIIKINTTLKQTLRSFSSHSYFPHGKLCKNKYIFHTQCLLWWDTSYWIRMGIPEGSWAWCPIVSVMGCLFQELPSSTQSLTAPGPAALVTSNKENSVELSKNRSSIYNLLSPLTVPWGWAYGYKTAVTTVDKFFLLSIPIFFFFIRQYLPVPVL